MKNGSRLKSLNKGTVIYKMYTKTYGYSKKFYCNSKWKNGHIIWNTLNFHFYNAKSNILNKSLSIGNSYI